MQFEWETMRMVYCIDEAVLDAQFTIFTLVHFDTYVTFESSVIMMIVILLYGFEDSCE